MTARTAATVGTNLILSSLLATLSYLPFELLAKSTLIFCLLLFILDPYPGSRLVALIAVGGVMLINRLRLKYVSAEGGEHQSMREKKKKKSE